MENFGNIKDTFKQLMIESIINKDDKGKKLFNKLKRRILKGVENVQEFLKKIKGNKKIDLIPTEVEYGQDKPPVESKINDNTQINEKYTNSVTFF